MSYATATVSPAERARSIAGVVGVHALLGAGVYLGLTISGVIDPPTFNPDVINVPIEDPVPPPEPVETPEPSSSESVITAPEPPIRIPTDSAPPADPIVPIIGNDVVLDPTPREIIIPGPPAPPATPAFTPTGPSPTNGPAGWITNNDYPSRALQRGWEGTTGYRLVVSSSGRVDACEVTRSSGHSILDREACRQLERRAEFNPAKDNRGERVVGTYTGQVTWQIPD